MKNRIKTIQFKVFVFYATVIMTVVSIFMTFIICDYYTTSREQIYQTLKNDVVIYSTGLEQEFDIMDSVALEILYSPQVKLFLQTNFGEEGTDYSSNGGMYLLQGAIGDLTAAVSPSNSVHQAIVHNLYERNVTSRDSYLNVNDIKQISWFEDVMNMDSKAYLTRPYLCTDKTMSTDDTTREYLMTLARKYKDTYGKARGIIEVRQYASVFFGEIYNLEKTNTYEEIIVLDNEHNQIYPYDKELVIEESYIKYIDEMDCNSPYVFEENEDFITIYLSKKTGFLMMMIESKEKVYADMNRYIVLMLLVAVVGIFTVMILSYFGSKQLTRPLNLLKNRIENYAIFDTKKKEKKSFNSNITEIEGLNQAFESMNLNLTESVQKLMIAQQQQLQYKLLAYQSQMNPHFLYNALANISALAEEDRSEDIMNMCGQLSSSLRYVASSGTDEVTLMKEIEFSKNFVKILQTRFGNDLKCKFDIEEEIMNQTIPKLCIQPLIENSEKAQRLILPPWNIEVIGRKLENGWCILVRDNGPGFTEGKLENLKKRIGKLNDTNTIPHIQLDGMGLINIYLRLKLMYDKNMIFEIRNLPKGGCEIMIGSKGKKDEKKIHCDGSGR